MIISLIFFFFFWIFYLIKIFKINLIFYLINSAAHFPIHSLTKLIFYLYLLVVRSILLLLNCHVASMCIYLFSITMGVLGNSCLQSYIIIFIHNLKQIYMINFLFLGFFVVVVVQRSLWFMIRHKFEIQKWNVRVVGLFDYWSQNKVNWVRFWAVSF
jgi:hypothetical protein